MVSPELLGITRNYLLPAGEAELLGRLRSQIQFGNEGKCIRKGGPVNYAMRRKISLIGIGAVMNFAVIAVLCLGAATINRGGFLPVVSAAATTGGGAQESTGSTAILYSDSALQLNIPERDLKEYDLKEYDRLVRELEKHYLMQRNIAFGNFSLGFLSVLLMFVGGTGMFIVHKVRQKKASEDVSEAARQAFIEKPTELEAKLYELAQSQEDLEERATEIARLLDEYKNAVSTGRLFNLYSKQIVEYQQETRSRATLSFAFALISMFAGFGFVIWGGSVLLQAKEVIVLAAGGLLSAVGGAMSGFITKTFLDVHKLSLTQLNRYFQQPVINDHILTAQRLADDSDDPETRKKAYDRIIESITKQIDSKGDSSQETA